MKKKIELYEKFFKEMKELEELEKDNLEESVFIEKNVNGERNKKIRTDLDESFLVIDKGKHISHLSEKERGIINEQNNAYNYERLKEKIGFFYRIVEYGVGIGKWLALL